MKEGKLYGAVTEYSAVVLNKMLFCETALFQGRIWLLMVKSLLLPLIQEENTGGE